MAIRCIDEQAHLFPPEVMAAVASHPPVREPVMELPFQPRETIDTRRCARILGLSVSVVNLMVKGRILTSYQLPNGRNSVPYRRIWILSVLDYCDLLRQKYGLAPRKHSLGRWPRDCDFLPFQLADTITVKDVCHHLDICHTKAIQLVEEGRLLGYQIRAESPWRISRHSLNAYIDKLRAQAGVPLRTSSR